MIKHIRYWQLYCYQLTAELAQLQLPWASSCTKTLRCTCIVFASHWTLCLLHKLQVSCIYTQVNAAACVIGMLDYSTASLCLAHSTPYIHIRQGMSTDEPFTCSLLHRHGLGVEMPTDTYHSGQWDSYLEQALALASSLYK